MTQIPPVPPHRLPTSAPLDSQLQKLRRRLAKPNAPNGLDIATREDSSTREDLASTFWMLFATLRRRLLVVSLISAILGFLLYKWTQAQPKRYKSSAVVEVIASSPKVFSNIREVIGHTFQIQRFYSTQVEILKSLPIYEKALSLRPALLDDPGFFGLDRLRDPNQRAVMMEKLRPNAAQILKKRATVQPIRNSSLIRVIIEDTDALRAKESAQIIVQAYQEHNRLFRLRATLNAYTEIKLRLEDYQGRHRELQKKMLDFRNKHNILTNSLTDRRSLAFKQLEELNQQMLRVMFRRIEKESQLGPHLQETQLKDPLNAVFLPLLENELISRLRSLHNELLLKEDEMKSRYREKHPEMQKLERRLKRLREVLTNQIQQIFLSHKAQLQSIRREERTMRQRVAQAKRDLQNLDELNLSLDSLQQQQTALNESLQFLNKRYFELQLLKDSTTTNVRVIEPPIEPKKPFAPRVLRTTLAGVALIFFGLFALFLLLELLDRSIRSLSDIEEKVGVTPIGEVPLLRNKKNKNTNKKEPLYNPDQPLSQIEEAIRSIRTNIFFMAPDSRKLRLLFTSPSPKEGKTFVATNVSIGIAHAGKRTILIDTDMRRPRMHKILELDYDRSKGVSSVIVGQHTLDEAMIKSDYPNLWLLPCGPIPPSPTELLQTDGFHRLFRELEERFDVIIFDTPPILNVTDAAVLSAYVDGCILISSSGSTTWNALKAAAYKLESVGGRIFGCILNKLSDRDRHYAYQRGYYHYGGYRYRYYGESDNN